MKKHLETKTYFSIDIDQKKVKCIVNLALKKLESNVKDTENYYFRVNMRTGYLGSNNEDILQISINKDCKGYLYCSTAYPVAF